MTDNIPPVADKVIAIDFDGTIFQWGSMYADTPPYNGAIDAIRRFRAEGWTIIILTSRMSPAWWDSEGWDWDQAQIEQYNFVSNRLTKYGIPFDRITAEKVPASFYIDDKAVEFSGKDGEWGRISRRVIGW